jgi:hypothetical protein
VETEGFACAMDKRSLTECDICTKFILPAMKRAGWDEMLQVWEEVYFTKGRIIVRGKLVTGGKAKKANFVLHYKANLGSRSYFTPGGRTHAADPERSELPRWR